jgi:dTDP-glucose 4,6-dehydratase
MTRTILLTGNKGFIFSHLNNYLRREYLDDIIIGIDSNTPAADRNRIDHMMLPQSDFWNLPNLPKYVTFQIDADINKATRHLKDAFSKVGYPDVVIHGAAESHVDHSLNNPVKFWETNTVGTRKLLQDLWDLKPEHKPFPKFIHMSTDEVVAGDGCISQSFPFDESSPLNPSSDYAASKAAAELAVKSFMRVHGINNHTIVRSVNCYGPGQTEKLFPTAVNNALNKKPTKIYGDGSQMRDWLHVSDLCRALDFIMTFDGRDIYHVSAGNERSNNRMVELVYEAVEAIVEPTNLDFWCDYVEDPRGNVHDERYFISSERIRDEFGWRPLIELDEGIRNTVRWYAK